MATGDPVRVTPAGSEDSCSAHGEGGLPSAAARAAFSVADRTYTWRDLLRAGLARGSPEAPPPHEDSIATAAEENELINAWRRARGLLSADDTVAWLSRWDLDVEDLRRHVSTERGAPPSEERSTWSEAVCSGRLAQIAFELAGKLALVGVERGELTAEALSRIDAAVARRGDELATPDALAAVVASHAESWTRVEVRGVRFADLDAAREAALCVRADGMSLSEVAALAAAKSFECSCLADGLVPWLRRPVLSAVPGEVVGPVSGPDGHAVVEILAKASADLGEPAVAARAREELLAQALRAAEMQVMWHERP